MKNNYLLDELHDIKCNSEMFTLVDMLTLRANSQPTEIAFTYLADGTEESLSITYSELDKKARSIAVNLANKNLQGERALMVYQSGIEFICAFFGCIYAGVIPVPAYPPRKNRNFERLVSVITDSSSSIVLTTKTIRAHVEPMFNEIKTIMDIDWLCTDSVDESVASEWKMPVINDETIALLQYTSGSTGNPKGVMVTHKNIIYNQKMMHKAFKTTSDDIALGWLPMFHDMGLIGMVLHPIYMGIPCIFFPPSAFLQSPIKWLKAIQKYKATMSVAPNFAFDLCVKDIKSEDLDGLDLSSLRFVLSGSETVRMPTIEKFLDKLESYGFSRTAISPSYGMAEATLLCTIGDIDNEPEAEYISINNLGKNLAVVDKENDEVQPVVNNGFSIIDEKVMIVDPDKKLACIDGCIGEIWLSGEHVAKGYWQNDEETENRFNAHLNITGEGPFLRTGDLGYIRNNNLYITGRLKEMIIKAGVNYYPQDIESSAANACENKYDINPINSLSMAAFSVEQENTEKLILVVEAERVYQRELSRKNHNGIIDPKDIANNIKKEVWNDYAVKIDDIVILKLGKLPKTSSGKIQRNKTKEKYINKTLDVLWGQELENEKNNAKGLDGASVETSVIKTVVSVMSDKLDIDKKDIKLDEELLNYGIDSINALRVLGGIEDILKIKLPETLLWDCETVEDIVVAINDQKEQSSKDKRLSITPDIEHRNEPFDLSDIQRAYWIGRSENIELGGVSCYFYSEYEINTQNIAAIQQAWNKVLDKHEMLSIVIDQYGQQRIQQNRGYLFKINDITGDNKIEQEKSLLATREKLSHAVLDTENGPLYVIEISKLNNKKSVLHFGIDLLLADVWSLMIVQKDWKAFCLGEDHDNQKSELSYRDYLTYEKSRRKTNEYLASSIYWDERVKDMSLAPDLPIAKSTTEIKQSKFSRRKYTLETEAWDKLKEYAKQNNITTSMVLCSAYASVLSKWSKSSNFTLNLTQFNRQNIHEDINKIVGDFTTTLLLEINYKENNTFLHNARSIQQQFRDDFKHRIVCGTEVLAKISKQHKSDKVAMPVVFTSAIGVNLEDKQNWPGKCIYSISQTPQVWIDNQVIETSNGLEVSWDVLDELFPEHMIDDMFQTYLNIIDSLAFDSNAWQQVGLNTQPIYQLENHAAINDTKVERKEQLLHSLFEENAETRPNHPAIITSKQSFTYKQVNKLANQLAHKLISKNVKPNQMVAIIMQKGWEQIVSCLGVLKAGAAYLPIDPELPEERINYLLNISDIKIVLTQEEINETKNWPETIAAYVVTETAFKHHQITNIKVQQKPDDLAYTIFTSGSTGVPKGVMIDHKGAVNTVLDINHRFTVSPNDRILAISPLQFDLSVYDIFGSLSAGATIVVPDASANADPENWMQLIKDENVSIWNSAPAFMKIMFEYVESQACDIAHSLRLVMMSGDWIPVELVEKIINTCKGTQVVSLGGATEASIWSIIYPINKVEASWNSIPYGIPMENQTFYVLDETFNHCPDWVTGHLYIGGIGLAKGYWKDDKKTQTSFIMHPETGERLYKTGDLGRYLPDGNIEFLGREDSQVKIHGYRIELGEIESVLNSHASVNESVVITWETNVGERQLISYVVVNDDINESNVHELSDYLHKHLPKYMVPVSYVILDQMPVTANGKVDRKGLPDPVIGKHDKKEASTEVELKLVEIWSNILGVENIGVDENFFEIGGYSQLAVRLIIDIREKLSIDLPIRALFESPTISLLAKRIEGDSSTSSDEKLDSSQLYARYGRQGIAKRIAAINADKQYTRAQGTKLYYQQDNHEIEVLDMVGGYGSTILGHNHPELIQLAIENMQSGLPMHAQHSNNELAGQLGKMLSDNLRKATGHQFIATLASTGTEAVEAAIKHAKMEVKYRSEQQLKYRDNLTSLMIDQLEKGQLKLQKGIFESAQRMMGDHASVDIKSLYKFITQHNKKVFEEEPCFLALSHAFHGMTSGSLSLTASKDFRRPFHWMGIRSKWIEHNKTALLEAINQETDYIYSLDLDQEGDISLRRRPWCNIAGIFVEPIQGEGGIYMIDQSFAQDIRELADKNGFPVILDEIQCGMARSGYFTAAQHLDLRGDYYTFSKSLGGGLAKVSALMVDENRYIKDFGYVHGSTFAEDKAGCSIAIKTLEIIHKENIENRCLIQGNMFRSKLATLQEKYPGVIKEIRGSGLMLGLELQELKNSPSFFFRALSQNGLEMVNLLIAGYLLNVKHVRIAPTKTRNTIRFLPSAYITEEEMDQVVDALDEVFNCIQSCNAGRLLSFIVNEHIGKDDNVRDWRLCHPAYKSDVPDEKEMRVAHIGHLEDDQSLLIADPSFAEISENNRKTILKTLFPFAKVSFTQQTRIIAHTGETVHLSIIGLPITGEIVEEMMRSEDRDILLEKIDEAIDLAKEYQCHTVGFGGYTSIVTLNCTAVATTEMNLTSGNSYTVALGMEGARKVLEEKGKSLSNSRVAIVGAKGNIGSISSRILAEDCSDILLIGRNVNDDSLKEVAEFIFNDAWQMILEKSPKQLSGIAKSIYETKTMQTYLAGSSIPQREGKTLKQALCENMYQSLMKELRKKYNSELITISDNMHDLADCDVIITATSSSTPVIFSDHLSDKVKAICDIATPKDVDVSVQEKYPNISILSGGMAKLPNNQEIQLMGTKLPLEHVYGCVAETTLLGVTHFKGHYSFGDMNKDQVKHIASIGKQCGYTTGELMYV